MSHHSRYKNSKLIVTNAAHAYAPSTLHYATLDDVLDFFQDPPDVDRLMHHSRAEGLFCKSNANLRLSIELTCQSRGGTFTNIPLSDQLLGSFFDDTTGDEGEGNSKDEPITRGRTLNLEYDGIQYDFSNSKRCAEANRSRIFLTALYLEDRFQELVRRLKELHRADLTVYSRNLRTLAYYLKLEPMLKGITVKALVTLYFQIVNAKRCLDAHLAETTPALFIPTHFCKIAERLVGYDNQIQKAKNTQKAAMDCINSNNNKNEPTRDQDTAVKAKPNNGLSLLQILASTSPIELPSSTEPATPTSPLPSSSSTSILRPTELSGNTREGMELEISRMQAQMTDLLVSFKTQQLTIETLQGKVETLETDLSKSKECQDSLKACLLRATNENNDLQVAIGRLDIDLEGTKVMTIKHDIQLRRMEKLIR